MFVLQKQKTFGPWYAATIFWNAKLSFEAVFSALCRFLMALPAPNVLFSELSSWSICAAAITSGLHQPKLRSLKKDASTSFLLVYSGVTGHRLPIEPIWTNFSIQRGQRTSEGTRLTSNKRSVMWTGPLFATNMLSWGWRSEGPPAGMPLMHKS